MRFALNSKDVTVPLFFGAVRKRQSAPKNMVRPDPQCGAHCRLAPSDTGQQRERPLLAPHPPWWSVTHSSLHERDVVVVPKDTHVDDVAECGIGAKLPTVLAEAFTSVRFRIAVAVRLNVKSFVTSKDASVWRQTCYVGPSIPG